MEENILSILPILPVKRTVLFPGVMMPLTIGRERSVAAGRAYVRDNYAWPSVLERFMTLARYVADAN